MKIRKRLKFAEKHTGATFVREYGKRGCNFADFWKYFPKSGIYFGVYSTVVSKVPKNNTNHDFTVSCTFIFFLFSPITHQKSIFQI